MPINLMGLMRTLALLLILPFLLGADGCGGSTGSGTVVDGIGTVGGSVGSGSKYQWDGYRCRLVEGKIQYSWNKFYTGNTYSDWFYIKAPSDQYHYGVSVLKLSGCAIDASSTIWYSTKNWLCVGDTVKINGNQCTIDYITPSDW